MTSGRRRRLEAASGRQHDLGDVPLVVFLGKMTPRKRLDVVMAAMPRVQMRAARLVVAGNDMGSGPAARQLASTLGIAERTQFLGLLTGRARLDLLTDADVVVYPSADEVFGLVPLEALLCGTPVVVADDSGCGEIVGALDGGAGRCGGRSRWRWPRRSIACWPRRRPGARGPRRGRPRSRNGLAGRWWQNKSMPCIEKSSLVDAGVSVVVPVLNGARWLPDVLAAIRAELADRPHEILVVDDGSRDESVEICRRGGDADVQVVDGPRRGAAAAVNAGLRLARFDLVAQIDQDVIVQPGWFATLIDALRDPRVAAAQGWYITDPAASALARVMSIDLEQRYARIDDGRSDHVCTGNVIWRLDAMRQRRRARRNAGLRVRQRLELSPDRRRLPPGDSA